MPKPQILQKLSHGKYLTQGNFPNFVDTFNGCTDRIANLKGDGDVNPLDGVIQVDNTDWDHPVIRFNRQLSGGGQDYGPDIHRIENQISTISSEISGLSSNSTAQIWDIEISGNGDFRLKNCTVRLARSYFFMNDITVQNPQLTDYCIILGIDHTVPPVPHISCGSMGDAMDMLSGAYSNCISTSIQPLYRITDGTIACDYRALLNIQAYDNRQILQHSPWEITSQQLALQNIMPQLTGDSNLSDIYDWPTDQSQESTPSLPPDVEPEEEEE